MSRCCLTVSLIGAVLLATAGCINVAPLVAGQMQEVVVRESPRWFEPNKVAIVDVEGFIGGGGSWLMPGTSAADVKEKLTRAADDTSVRAIVLRVNTPGGEATASDTIYHEVIRFREQTGRPVVAALRSMATSGGYYAALAADRIVAEPTTVTGSVGVSMHYVNMEGLLGKIGLKAEPIESGAMKGIGSPTRAMTPEERQVLQGVINALFERFIGLVRERRPTMTEANLKAIADGRVVTAQQAFDLHLVDEIGYLDDALDQAYKLAGIQHADVIIYRPFPSYSANIYSSAASEPDPVARGLGLLLPPWSGATFLYLWTPGA